MPRVSFHRLNANRPVDWRWQIACAIAAPTPGYKVRSSNGVVVEAARFLAELGQHHDHDLPAELVYQYPAIAAAYELSRRADWERLLLEARILSGEPLDEIARKCQISLPVIEKYEVLFFAVRNSLKATAFCWHAAIRCRRASPETPPALEKLIRTWSYFGGARVLESALPAIGAHGVLIDRPANLASAEGRRDEHVRLAVKLYLAAEEAEYSVELMRVTPFVLRVLERMAPHHATRIAPAMFDLSDILSQRPRRRRPRSVTQAAA